MTIESTFKRGHKILKAGLRQELISDLLNK